MTWPVLTRASEALTDDETVALLRDRMGDGIVDVVTEFGDLTLVVTPAAWHDTVLACRDEPLLTFDMFDCLFGVDAGEAGMDVVVVLYSTSKGRRVMLRTTCEGGRDAPRLATVTDVYPGANWMEREAFDMFGIEFDDHPGLLPRILCVENFEGWPLRKDFALASRVAKPWPGVSEPVEKDEDGNIIFREPAIGEAAGPSGLDEVIAKQAREANADPAALEAGEDGGGQADAEPTREEVELDQDVYDELIAAGKSERIARSKAKAAFIKAQRKAEREAAAAQDSDTTSDADDATSGAEDSTSDAADQPAEDPAAAADAKAAAEETRTRQAEARAARAAETAETDGDGQSGDDTPGIPEGNPVEPPARDGADDESEEST
ncbi:MAG TPA: NADH-quinone oxidoreductase subunit C [Nitriliruptoraceae bacterium]|nr:NADH-quinone oxidoreductase subunit C [Nitriliruptoraceae bacterium]